MAKKTAFLLFLLSNLLAVAQAQDIYARYGIYRNPASVFLNQFSFNLSSGYASTVYQHSLEGFYFFQDNNSQQILRNNQEIPTVFLGYENWLTDPVSGLPVDLTDIFDLPYAPLEFPVNNPLLINQQYLADADSIGLSFKAINPTIPVLFSIHYQWNDFRIGVGFQYEQHTLNEMKPSVLPGLIRPYQPAYSKTYYTKIFGLFGYQFHEWWDYSFVAEVQLGRASPGPQINTTAIGIGQNFFANVGVSIEKHFSEYLRLTIRPSYDLKSYVINLPDASTIRHVNPAFMIQVGFSINIPEIPRSPIKSDHVQLKHVIVNPQNGVLMEVRGQPLWKKQNPKVGENHRRLYRYKLRNRRKIDPY